MISLSDLFTPLTTDQAQETILDMARAAGLDVDSWSAGDPTRTLLAIVARALSWVTTAASQFASGGFRTYATGDWLTLVAADIYGVTRREATYATGTVTLTNGGGGVYVIAAGDLTFSNTATGKTYRNTSGGTLNALGTLDVDVIAEEAGSASTAAIGAIDALVTTILGVTCSNAAAVVGIDAETDAEVTEACGESLAALSPDGPRDAYSYVAKHTARPDGSIIEINRTRVVATSATGDVEVTLATATGAPAGGDVTLIDTALQEQVVPATATLTTQAATEHALSVVYTAYVPSTCALTDTEVADAVEASLVAYCSAMPIGGRRLTPGGTGYVFHDLLRARISDAVADIFSVTLSTPAADVALLDTDVPVVTVSSYTIVRVDQ